MRWLRDHPRALLADEPGLGKSRQLIEASEGRTLVVAPAMVLDGGTWRDEVGRWADDPARFTFAPYTSINARQGNRVLAEVRPEYAGPWDTLILDESHYIKGRDTKWTLQLLKLSRQVDRVMLATGTPIPNWAQELYTSLVMLKPEASKRGSVELGSYWRWAERWFDCTPEKIYIRGKFGRPEAKEVANVGTLLGCTEACALRPATDPCRHYRKFFRANLDGVFLQRLRDDVLSDLPPLQELVVETPMVPAQARIYKTLRKEFIADLTDGTFKVAWSASAKHIMLDQVATGQQTLEPGAGPASGKLDRLAYDLASRSAPTLVVAHYRSTVEASHAVATGLGLRSAFVHGGTGRGDRGRIVEQFKRGELDVLVGSLETIAEGLTLTAADMVIFVETSWKPSRNIQAMRRIHRLGQTRPCTALIYTTPGTVDVGKKELCARKLDHQMRSLSPAQLREIV